MIEEKKFDLSKEPLNVKAVPVKAAGVITAAATKELGTVALSLIVPALDITTSCDVLSIGCT
jgi:hypothetical protein